MLALAMCLTAPAIGADVERIEFDVGGQIGPYIQKMKSWRKAGRRVVVDGPCLSACTLILGIMPRDRICVTWRALFGFHTAWKPGQDGAPVVNSDATQFLWGFYPDDIKAWILSNGGLSGDMLLLGGKPLTAMIASCRP
ncbi:hypothetical protein [Aquabacter spiritensis]|uniref:Uncharacterized protein n=1 Tax=Aquabacter spiritensis TaxID=933073 RepID=A0A4R3LYX5_9HYPH|nr:hypothetical protein [Aquabacter spiritensis]TCT03975.1 hypothetical protein EDC64_108141 [Aquabacter spiritensis]